MSRDMGLFVCAACRARVGGGGRAARPGANGNFVSVSPYMAICNVARAVEPGAVDKMSGIAPFRSAAAALPERKAAPELGTAQRQSVDIDHVNVASMERSLALARLNCRTCS
ncbi:hypothetical protein [Xanthomonas sacchari]|uniref:hypothetical protein n=1 Tax=Xanthomonas sacchari TaxID=56458 RepID=UPI0020C1FB2E|nr:hypothetical protein [Xanthomonas sacchari]